MTHPPVPQTTLINLRADFVFKLVEISRRYPKYTTRASVLGWYQTPDVSAVCREGAKVVNVLYEL